MMFAHAIKAVLLAIAFSVVAPSLAADAGTAQKQCTSSATHNLVLGKDGYECLEASNHCESDFVQLENSRDDCESKAGCKYLPGVCYCPPDVNCVCGGGPPSICVLASDNREFIRRHQSVLDGTAYGHAPVGQTDGELLTQGDDLVAWDAQSDQWLTPVDFWLAYAKRRGGLTWGRGTSYPPYAEVKELDTFLIETAQGPCLMEFFHSRWRRANDVRRWDEGFNEYGGCPHVFD